jgi:hypothetical protein
MLTSGSGLTSGRDVFALDEKLVLGRGCFLGRKRSDNPEVACTVLALSWKEDASSSIASGRDDSNEVRS